MLIRTWLAGALLALSLLAHATSAAPAEPRGGPATAPVVAIDTAPVKIDGQVLFQVRGTSSYPAARRAATIRDRIITLARDPSFRPDSLRLVPEETGVNILAGEQLVTVVFEADAELEQVKPRELARVYRERIKAAVEAYRSVRTRAALVRGALLAAGATMALAAVVFVMVRLGRRLDALISRRAAARVQALELQSHQVLKASTILAMLGTLLRGLRIAILVAAALAYVQFTMSLFPWTRPFAVGALELVTEPLATMALAAVSNIPNVMFLAVLVVVIRLILRMTWLFFDAVARGRIRLRAFEAEWAQPTYKIVRFAVVAFGAVVAYPYIPGSGTAAFQGISLFIGVIFSLGSSSVIANLIAGYTMTYRRAFKVGDRVKIGEVLGDVMEIRPQVTRVRSLKNEEVVVPNSIILNSQVVNYTSLAAGDGLILHTTVGIGYETPWRQVEAMLLMAAERTAGIERQPPPFVLQRRLGDFAVEYELNVRTRDPRKMMALYTGLHRNILDVFNEYGVQIMTPAYEADTPQPKLVPRTQWHLAPAKPDEGDPPTGAPAAPDRAGQPGRLTNPGGRTSG